MTLDAPKINGRTCFLRVIIDVSEIQCVPAVNGLALRDLPLAQVGGELKLNDR